MPRCTYNQRTLTAGGSITAWLFSSFISMDSTASLGTYKEEKKSFLMKSSLAKLETSRWWVFSANTTYGAAQDSSQHPSPQEIDIRSLDVTVVDGRVVVAPTFSQCCSICCPRRQCDQIEPFPKVLSNKFSYKSSPIITQVWAIVKTISF